MITMYDTVDLEQLPEPLEASAALAGYVGGNWPTYQTLAKRHPAAHRLSIAVNALEDAECLDVETGDAHPSEAPAWVRRQQHRGVWRPCLYANLSTMPAVVAALNAAGIHRYEVRLWVAHYTYAPHIPAGYDACQWTDRSHGRNLDESLCHPDFFELELPAAPRHVRRRLLRKRPARIPSSRGRVAPHPKVAGSGLGAALGILLTHLINASGGHVDPATAGAISTVAGVLAGYFTPARR